MVSKDLLDILACPACKTPVILDGERLICKSADCRRFYRIEDDIPVMLIDESEELPLEDWSETAAAKH